MVGHTYYHVLKDPSLTPTGMVGHTYYHPGKVPNTYIHWNSRKHLLPYMERLYTYIHQHGRTHLLPFVERLCTYIPQHGRAHLLPYVERPCTYICWHDRTHLLSSKERINTYILPWEETILPPCQKGTSFIFDHARNQSYHHVRRAQHLHMTMGGTNPPTMSKGNTTYIWPWEEPILPPCQKGRALTS